jgi:hypothetical protein
MSPYLAHIHITSQTFTVSNLPGGFMSGLIRSCIICVTKTGETLLNRPTSHGKNIRHIFFESKVLFSCPKKILYNATCITNIVPPSPTIPGTIGPPSIPPPPLSPARCPARATHACHTISPKSGAVEHAVPRLHPHRRLTTPLHGALRQADAIFFTAAHYCTELSPATSSRRARAPGRHPREQL